MAAALRDIGCDQVDCGCYEGDQYRFIPPADIPDLSAGEGVFPFFQWGHIEFGVQIPAEEQYELILPSFVPVEATAFFVRIEYCYWNPIGFVALRQPEDGAVPRLPSNGVAIVREWLKKRLATTAIQFQTLAPSPFPGEFYLRPGSADGDDDVRVRRTNANGRPTYEFAVAVDCA
ncbi:MAG: hypothetical protein ACYCXW_14605 [Solirubrobacteraceae bacterium]